MPRQLAYLLLGQIRFIEGTADAEFSGREAAGAVIPPIVCIVTVDDHGLPILGYAHQMGVELVLAVVAAVGGIRPIFRPLELPGLNNLVMKAEPFRNLDRHLSMAFGIAGAVGRDGQRPAAERVVGDVGKISAVGAAAVGDDDRAERREPLSQGPFFRRHSSKSSSSSSSSSLSSSSSSASSSRSSSSSSRTRSSWRGARPITSRLEPHSGQLSWSPLSTSNSSTSISASHSGQVAIHSSTRSVTRCWLAFVLATCQNPAGKPRSR